MNLRAFGTELSFEELARDAEYDVAVKSTSGIDHFCSSSLWTLPALHHLLPETEPFIRRSPHGYLAFARRVQDNGARVLHPLEAVWALPSPLVGADPQAVASWLTETLAVETVWDAAIVTGIDPRSVLWRSVVTTLGRRFEIARGPDTKRYVAELHDGLDGFLAKRSAGFGRNLRKAQKRAAAMGVELERADAATASEGGVFDRVLSIEGRSWKGRSGAGIDSEPMRSFYRAINDRLVEREARRLVFARVDGEDIGYIFGGIFGETYRGLQFSFDDRFRSLSLGNLMQIGEIESAANAGLEYYDLGTEVAYKKRWGDRVFTTSSLYVYS